MQCNQRFTFESVYLLFIFVYNVRSYAMEETTKLAAAIIYESLNFC